MKKIDSYKSKNEIILATEKQGIINKCIAYIRNIRRRKTDKIFTNK